MMRADYCPVANEPCQAMCLDGCRLRNKRTTTTPEQRDEAMRLADALRYRSSDDHWREVEAAPALLRTLAAEPAPDAQPVGRVRWFTYEGIVNKSTQEAVLFDGISLPDDSLLYIHPAPAQTPLTDEQLISLWESRTSMRGSEFVLSLGRAIERAHGIGETP